MSAVGETAVSATSIVDGEVENKVDNDEKTLKRCALWPFWEIEEKKYVLILFTLINIFLFADQNLLAPNLSVIAAEFNMTDDERDTYLGGYISIGFFAVGGIVALIVGYLADTVNRKWTFAGVVVLGELSCMLTYWVPTGSIDEFWYGLWLTRTFTGIALGGAVPIQYSIFGDYFSADERGKAVAGINIALGIGVGGGQYMAGMMTPDFRTPFLLVSIPAFILVAIYCYTTEEPPRGVAEKILDSEGNLIALDDTITWAKFRKIFSRPTALLIIMQGLPGIFPWGVAQVFLNDFLNVEKELEPSESANILLFWGLGIAISIIFAGWLTDKLYTDHKTRLPLIAGITTLIAPWPVLYVIQGPPLDPAIYIVLLVPSGFVAGFAGIIVKTLLMNVTIPETRGSAFAIQSLVDELGKGFGPYLVSQLIVAAGDRTSGITIAIMMWIPCGIIICLISCFLEKDVLSVEKEISDAAEGKKNLGEASL